MRVYDVVVKDPDGERVSTQVLGMDSYDAAQMAGYDGPKGGVSRESADPRGSMIFVDAFGVRYVVTEADPEASNVAGSRGRRRRPR